jgi:hypothetical protein
MDTEVIMNVLRDIQFPIHKDQLLQAVEQKGALELLPMLKQLPAATFGSAEEVVDKLGASDIASRIPGM